MARIVRYLAQAAAYASFAALIGVFADWPVYTHFPADQGLIKLSFTHTSQRKAECRRRTREELAKLAPNMRKPLDCSRGRVPLTIELALDGDLVYRDTVPPGGFSGDAPSRVYERFPVPVGSHRIAVRMRDSARAEGFDYVLETDVQVAPRQVVVVDFRSESGSFVLK